MVSFKLASCFIFCNFCLTISDAGDGDLFSINNIQNFAINPRCSILKGNFSAPWPGGSGVGKLVLEQKEPHYLIFYRL